MNISLVGVNHRTASLEIREKAAIRSVMLGDALELLRQHVPHGIILSTCNRTEVYTIPQDSSSAAEASLNFLQNHLDTNDTTLHQHTHVLGHMDRLDNILAHL
ncbi:MAG: hypothetical protein V3R96_04875 [Dehalococcoidales bacterium]